MKTESMLSAGIDIGTTTTHLVISRIGIGVTEGFGTVPSVHITSKKVLFKSDVVFTPLLPDGKIDARAVTAIIKEQYKNMFYYFEKDDKAVKLIQKAFNKCKKEYEFVAVRGGTDGARITYMGLPCPNIGTGDRCCHGRYEHVVINELYEMFEIISTLLEL